MYDVIIVGAGAAGLSAGIYASRRALTTLIISPDIGGQAGLTDEVENYPGVGFVSGFDLMQKFKADAEKFGCKIVIDEVIKIVASGLAPAHVRVEVNSVSTEHDRTCTVHTATGTTYESRTIILAFGLTPMQLGVPGETELRGKGVSYCATCDGPFFKDKVVAVVGGGNSALDAALYLSKICTKVYLVHRRDEFRGEEILIERVTQATNIEIFYNSVVQEIKGTGRVNGVMIADVSDATKTRAVVVDGVFVEVGYHAKTKWLQGFLELDPRRQVVIDKTNRTSVPGLFGAGDVTDIDYKQIVISAGEGAKAALEAYKYIQSLRGKQPVAVPDWGLKS